jgi:hypothetical protein
VYFLIGEFSPKSENNGKLEFVFGIYGIWVIFSMKNPFISCLKSYFSAKSLVKFFQLKIQKLGVRQAEYQRYAGSTFGSVNFTCNDRHA